MNPDNSATYQEIVTQPRAWQAALAAVSQQADALRQLWRQNRFSEIVFTGCGSTYYLSLAATALWQTLLPIPARGVPAGELWLYPDANFPPVGAGQTLLVAISRSGSTSETVAVTERFSRREGGKVVVITAYPQAPLAELGDITISIPAAQEESVAQTRSFAAMYVASTALMATFAGRDDLLQAMERLPGCGRALLDRSHKVARSWGENLQLRRFYFLGSGPRYGLACEANLKMKEMTLSDSEPFHFFEFRHGPMSMVNETTGIIGLVSKVQRAEEMKVLQEMAKLGGQILALVPQKEDRVQFGAQFSAWDCDPPAAVANVLYLPLLQLMAHYRAVAKGLDPDRPSNLTAVVTLDLQP